MLITEKYFQETNKQEAAYRPHPIVAQMQIDILGVAVKRNVWRCKRESDLCL